MGGRWRRAGTLLAVLIAGAGLAAAALASGALGAPRNGRAAPAMPPGTWEVVSTPITRGHMALACPAPNDCWMANGRQVFPTDPVSTSANPLMHWDGASWEVVAGSPLASDVDFVSPHDGWAVWGECERFFYNWCKGAIYRWDGLTWTEVMTTPFALVAVDAVSAGEAWFAGGSLIFHRDRPGHLAALPAVYQWDGNGIVYKDPPQELGCMARDVERAPGGRLWIGCTDIFGALLGFDGTSWVIEDFGGQAFPTSLDFTSATAGWAAGGTNFLRYDGSVWESVEMPLTEFYAVDLLNPSVGWAAGYSGHLAYYDGSTWTVATPVVSNTLVDLVLSSHVDGWAISYDRYPPGEQDVVLRYRRPDVVPRVFLPLTLR